MSRHPTLKLKAPQPLSHAQARNADDEQVKDFFSETRWNLCSFKLIKQAYANL